MRIETGKVDREQIKAMRELYLRGLDCQMVHYSFIGRGLADIYSARVGSRDAAYVAVSNHYDKGRLIELFVLPEFRGEAEAISGALLAASGATHLEAQTNSPPMMELLRSFGVSEFTEKILFREGSATALTCPDNGNFRARNDKDGPGMFGRAEDTLSAWVVEARGEIVAAGGFLTHYNPPYGDVFMETAEGKRRRGFGSYLVQEVRRICREAGRTPAARCDPTNLASQKTLVKGGMEVCGEILVAEVKRA